MLRLLARAGYVRAPAQTPAEFAAGLPEPLQAAARAITGSFELSRYAGLALSEARRQESLRLLTDLRRETTRVGRGRRAA